MRICSPQLGLAQNSTLGGEVFDREILLGLAKNGFEIEIILPKNKPHDENVKNWKITQLPITHFPAFLGNFIFIPYLFLIYRTRPFQILRIHQPQFIGIAAILFKLFYPSVILVSNVHQFRESSFGPFSNYFIKKWDYIFCDSNFVRKLILEKYKVPLEKIKVVHNGAPNYLKPTGKDRKLLMKLNLKGKKILIFMGFFTRRKNPFFLLELLKIIKSKNVSLLMIGNGPLEKDIKQLISNNNFSKQVRIIKPVFGKEKNRFLNLADIFLHPSIDEGFALAPLEAMACSKPVLISKGYSSNEAVEDGLNGYVCRQNDYYDWASKIDKLLNDQKLRNMMGDNALLKVKKEFQWEYVVSKHLDLFNKIRNAS